MALVIGVGFIVLAVIWLFFIALFILLSRAEGSIAYAGVGGIILAVVITLVLWFFPRGAPDADTDYIVYDEFYARRTAIVSLCGIFLLAGSFLMCIAYCCDPQRARPLNKLRSA